MFWDAAKCRKICVEKNKSEPLTEVEIYAATRIKYRIDSKTKKTVGHEQTYRKQWILILNQIGEFEPKGHVPEVKLEPIRFARQHAPNSHRPVLIPRHQAEKVCYCHK